MTKLFTFISLLVFITASAVAQKNVDAAIVKQLIAKNASALGFSTVDVNNTRVASFYYDKQANVIMAYLQQTYKGVDIYNALTTVAFRDNKVASVTTSRITEVEKKIATDNPKPSVTPAVALRNAASNIKLSLVQPVLMPLHQSADAQEFEYDKLGIAQNNINVRLMWTPVNADTRLHLSWQVTIHTLQSNDLWLVKVDALDGRILRKENLTTKCSWEPIKTDKIRCVELPQYNNIINNKESNTGIEAINSASYNVIPYPYEDPNHAPPTLVTNPWTIFPNTNATTLKWNSDGTTDYDSTKGNNVYAHADLLGKNKNGGAAKSSTPLPDLTFNFTPFLENDPIEEPATTNFGITNLFYWNNVMHDMTYQYGFDEAAGNFQLNNLGRGGKEGDFVIADGLDGDTTVANNANFATPVDGNSPRMQIGVFDPSIFKILKINAPAAFAGYKPATESNVSLNNKLAQTGIITSDVVRYMDLNHSDSSTACGDAANATALVGKIAYVDRGSCTFAEKFHSAQTAGARAIIVGNVAEGDPRYTGSQASSTGNRLVIMTADDNSITIPGVFIGYDTAQKMKTYLNTGTVVNATLAPTPRIDGELDNGVVTHEHAHGISTRLTGGPNNSSCLDNAEQMGEGWSDYFALMMTTNWATAQVSNGTLPRPIGNYAFGQGPEAGGIRTYPYSTSFTVDPWTYDSLRTSSFPEYSYTPLNTKDTDVTYVIYYTGDFWATTLWEMTWELIKTEGINTTFADASQPGGNSISMRLVMEGMKLQKCNPGCVDGRDGILKADTLLYGGKYSAAIWRAFARRGLGVDANQGSNEKIKDAQGSYLLPSALPAVWGSFTAEKINNSAVLKWTTITEQNTDHFAVERSFDGRTYTEVATVKAAGNSTVTQSYSYTDLKPVKGNNIYRIRLVDRDGKYNYSDAKTLNFDDIKNLISVSPNPAHGKVILTVKQNQKMLQVQLFNSVGQQVASSTLSGETLTIDVTKLPRGSYYISIIGEDINQKEKLIIQ